MLYCRVRWKLLNWSMSSSKEEYVHRQLLPASNNDSWRRRWHPTPVLLPGKSHGWRSLVGCSPWGLDFHFSLSCIGEGNGNPLQCSCLENPRDSRAWWAAVYGVTQSRTRLKWLSSSSSSNNDSISLSPPQLPPLQNRNNNDHLLRL